MALNFSGFTAWFWRKESAGSHEGLRNWVTLSRWAVAVTLSALTRRCAGVRSAAGQARCLAGRVSRGWGRDCRSPPCHALQTWFFQHPRAQNPLLELPFPASRSLLSSAPIWQTPPSSKEHCCGQRVSVHPSTAGSDRERHRWQQLGVTELGSISKHLAGVQSAVSTTPQTLLTAGADVVLLGVTCTRPHGSTGAGLRLLLPAETGNLRLPMTNFLWVNLQLQ